MNNHINNKNRYRVFISYSHEDQDLVSVIADILDANGLQPMWDRQFAYGHGFHEQIKTFIAHSHVFLPVITKTADERKWVHQEIGYAMSLNIPVLPIAAGRLPGEMIQQILAVQLKDEKKPDVATLKQHLSPSSIANLIQRFSSPADALFRCAQYTEDRATMMTKYSNDVRHIGANGVVRQKGGLSSFHIPTQTITHRIWKDRYGNIDRGPVHCNLQREERLALGYHAGIAGCKLIINPYLDYDSMWGRGAQYVRLNCLCEFLESMTDENCQVTIMRNMDHTESLTILGDWFVAESVSARQGQGYRQTIFTRHAPSMQSRIQSFDDEFSEHLNDSRWKLSESRVKTIEEVKKIMADLEKKNKLPDH